MGMMRADVISSDRVAYENFSAAGNLISFDIIHLRILSISLLATRACFLPTKTFVFQLIFVFCISTVPTIDVKMYYPRLYLLKYHLNK